MAQPLPSPSSNGPLRALLKDVNLAEKQLRSILRDGAEEAERLIPKLIEQNSTGGKLKAAQSAIVLRELRVLMAALWGDLGPAIRNGVKTTVLTASQGEDILFKFMTGKQKAAALLAFKEQAKAGVEAVLAKAANGIPLASSVYRTQALTTGLVHRRVNNGLLLGHSAQRLAKDVRDLIHPDVAGGVSYAAMRLARTELNNAFKTSQENRYKDEPWTKGMQWHLSGSHPVPDECNLYADADDHGLGPGVYPFGERPHSHPNCLCYLTAVQTSEDEFIEGFLSGEYDEYLGEATGTPETVDVSRSPRAAGRTNASRPAPAGQARPKVEGRDLEQWGIENTRDGSQDTALNAPSAFSDPCDRTLAAIGEEQGFSGTPSPGTVAGEVAAGGVELWRGVVPFKGKAAGFSDEQGEDPAKARTAESLVEQFRSGAYEPGTGIYGNGFYFSVARRVAQHFATQKKKRLRDPDLPPGQVFRVALRAGAKVIDYDQLLKDMQKWRAEAWKNEATFEEMVDFKAPPGKINPNYIAYVMADPGRFAAMRGYDAILVRGKQDGGPFVKGEPSAKNSMGQKFSAHDQYVILNRTAVVMEPQ